MTKRKVPPQLRQHAFKAGSTKTTKSGAKGGRKSPPPASASPAKPATTKASTKKSTTRKTTTAKRTKKS
jgi:hypothetical protein